MILRVKEVLHHEKSQFQDVLIFESTDHGRVMVLDNVIQSTERDEFSYQEMITHLAMNSHPDPKRVLVIGGGDGGVLREVVKHECVEKAVLCDIDEVRLRRVPLPPSRFSPNRRPFPYTPRPRARANTPQGRRPPLQEVPPQDGRRLRPREVRGQHRRRLRLPRAVQEPLRRHHHRLVRPRGPRREPLPEALLPAPARRPPRGRRHHHPRLYVPLCRYSP